MMIWRFNRGVHFSECYAIVETREGFIACRADRQGTDYLDREPHPVKGHGKPRKTSLERAKEVCAQDRAQRRADDPLGLKALGA